MLLQIRFRTDSAGKNNAQNQVTRFSISFDFTYGGIHIVLDSGHRVALAHISSLRLNCDFISPSSFIIQ